MTKIKKTKDTVPLKTLYGYAFGEGATALTIWPLANFGMLFYTQILGISASLAGLAISVTLLWDAVTDPIMGFVSDNTRTRYGRRHPYVLVGGILLAIIFLWIWRIPAFFSSTWAIFVSILVLNLVLRTCSTIFIIPYVALGFEICNEYTSRSRLQGIRLFLAQIINLFATAGAWLFFFKDRIAADGSRLDGGLIKENYMVMSATFGIVAIFLVFLCIWGTRGYAIDNRKEAVESKKLMAFFSNFGVVFKNRYIWPIIGFFFIAQSGMFIFGTFSNFNMIYFMELSNVAKTCTLSVWILATSLGSLGLTSLGKRMEKRTIGFLGIVICIVSNCILYGLFRSELIAPNKELSVANWIIPLGIVVYILIGAIFTAGWGLLVPLTNSMVADISEVDYRTSGHKRDGSYAAVFSFILKVSVAIGNMICGFLLEWSGVVSGAETQTAEVTKNIYTMTFLSGPALLVPALIILLFYPVDKKFMEKIKAQ